MIILDICVIRFSFYFQVKILSGDHKDETGVLINIDKPDGVIKMDGNELLIILQLKFLAKYVPSD